MFGGASSNGCHNSAEKYEVIRKSWGNILNLIPKNIYLINVNIQVVYTWLDVINQAFPYCI